MRNPENRSNSTNALRRWALIRPHCPRPPLYRSQAARSRATSSREKGIVGRSVTLGGFNLVAGLLLIQSLSQQKRKNARKASNFFLAAIFLFGHVDRNLRKQTR